MLAIADPTRPWVPQITQGFMEVIDEAPRPPTVYVEYLDAARFAEPDYLDDFREWLRQKYRTRHIDLLVVRGQESVQFLAKASGDPWPGVPILWGEFGQLTIDISQSLPGATGVVLESHTTQALQMIKSLVPDTEQVALVYGGSAVERARYAGWSAVIRNAKLGLEPIDLGGLSMDDLLARVADLPERTVALMLDFEVDGAGRHFAFSRPCELISPIANRPLFALFRMHFGCGVVGGLLLDFEEGGRVLADQALKYLQGELTSTVTIPVARHAALLFDARQLERWRIAERRLPAGSSVQFRPPSLTERLPVRIGLALLLLSAVSATAWRGRRAVQRRRERLERAMSEQTLEVVRQQDEAIGAGYRLNSMKKDVERANGQVLAVLGQLDLGVLLLDPSGIVQHASESARRLLAPDEEAGRLEGRAWDECLSIVESDRVRVRARIAAPLLTGERIPIQIAVGGRQYWMELDVREAPRPGDGCMLYLRDVTEISGSVGGERHEGLYGLLGRSSAMHLLYKQIRDVARVDATVLVEGETGSGKELVAHAVHRASGRAARPFVAVNAAGFAEPLLASQLFGHRRGAFTGAVDDQIGLFEAANGGTLFLDEIGDVPLGVQASLLRVLQEREIVRLGDSHPTQLDVRFVAATHRNLAHEVEAGRFREDLLYRIRVATVQVPPLRDRADDVPLLVDAFVADAAPLAGRPIPRVSHSAMDVLMRCQWPGNVRQLKSAVEQAVISGSGPILRVEDLPSEILNGGQTGSADAEERARLIDALRRSNGNRNEAARLLGIGRATLYRKLAAHGIRAPR